MAVRQPSKLLIGVRFPSPAPDHLDLIRQQPARRTLTSSLHRRRPAVSRSPGRHWRLGPLRQADVEEAERLCDDAFTERVILRCEVVECDDRMLAVSRRGAEVLADCPIHAALPAADLERARRFYAEKLGLTPETELPDGLFYRCGGTRFLIFPSQGAASGTHTQMTWSTADIDGEVSALKARDVVFEEIDTPELETVNSVATIGQSKGAWFKDSEGNMLALGQFG
jgi:catechol 2,3-dioxygenase-like lactoylglutathione lyase family enzyme